MAISESRIGMSACDLLAITCQDSPAVRAPTSLQGIELFYAYQTRNRECLTTDSDPFIAEVRGPYILSMVCRP